MSDHKNELIKDDSITPEVIGSIKERLDQLRVQIANIEQNRVGDDYIQSMKDYFEYGEDKAQELGDEYRKLKQEYAFLEKKFANTPEGLRVEKEAETEIKQLAGTLDIPVKGKSSTIDVDLVNLIEEKRLKVEQEFWATVSDEEGQIINKALGVYLQTGNYADEVYLTIENYVEDGSLSPKTADNFLKMVKDGYFQPRLSPEEFVHELNWKKDHPIDTAPKLDPQEFFRRLSNQEGKEVERVLKIYLETANHGNEVSLHLKDSVENGVLAPETANELIKMINDGYFKIQLGPEKHNYLLEGTNSRNDGADMEIKETLKYKKYQFIEDPGHAWLEVSTDDVRLAGIAPKISKCSYVNAGKVYLEEDCDAPLFIKAVGLEPDNIIGVYQENTPIRTYARWSSRVISNDHIQEDQEIRSQKRSIKFP